MTTKYVFQSQLASDLMRYISLKQALGRSFKSTSYVLFKLDRFLCRLGTLSPDLTAATFEQWCQTMDSICANTRSDYMRVVRNFCLYRRRTSPTCFVPDLAQFPQGCPRIQPYIFSAREVGHLLSLSAAIPNSPRSPLRGSATRLAIVLLYTTGLRHGELLRLSARDYDPKAQTLLIRDSKLHKSRLLPLPNDVNAEVARFFEVWRTIRPSLANDAPLFWSHYCGGQAYCSN